jgi:methylmalonyl-CoA mutase
MVAIWACETAPRPTIEKDGARLAEATSWRRVEDLGAMTDTAAPLDLARGFAPADYDMWRQLVEKALQGDDFDKRLVTQTADGVRIKPLYTRDDALPGAQDSGPGASPFTRGTSAQADDHGWQIHQRVIAPDPAAANAAILEELEGGANGVVLQIAGPGQLGIRVAGASDMAAALAGVHLDYAPVQLAGGLEGLNAARHFLGALASLKPEPGAAVARLNMDPIGTLARFGLGWAPLQTALAETVALAGDARANPMRLSAVLVDATVPHEAGASEAQELSFLAASLVAYLRAFEAAGIAPSDAFAGIAFALSVDTDLFLTAAKLRAARTLIARIAEAANASAAAMHITAVTSARMMAKRDPWTNMLRTTAACAGAAFGGANAITVLPFSWALGEPDRFARRIARNTQLVLQEESSLGRVVDPVGGSWYVESLTDELAGKAWTLFQEIEAKGGIATALSSGALQDDIALIAEVRVQSLACGRLELTGISYFPHLGADGVKVAPHPAVPPLKGKREVRALTPHRLAEPFEALRDAADAHLAETGTRPRVFMANLGPIVEHNTRSTWAWNFLAGGGIEGLTSDGYADGAAAAAAFKASDARIACLCSSDAIYAQEAQAAAKALKAVGAQRVLMAGRPGETEAALRAAGVDGFLFNGGDALATLTELQKALGVSERPDPAHSALA